MGAGSRNVNASSPAIHLLKLHRQDRQGRQDRLDFGLGKIGDAECEPAKCAYPANPQNLQKVRGTEIAPRWGTVKTVKRWPTAHPHQGRGLN
jgi:hypothetical protein